VQSWRHRNGQGNELIKVKDDIEEVEVEYEDEEEKKKIGRKRGRNRGIYVVDLFFPFARNLSYLVLLYRVVC
jgi:tetrahydromethanopterin S-methyltransferase subunit G